jgi:hypothetical protein
MDTQKMEVDEKYLSTFPRYYKTGDDLNVYVKVFVDSKGNVQAETSNGDAYNGLKVLGEGVRVLKQEYDSHTSKKSSK